jgi:hypothetical protein
MFRSARDALDVLDKLKGRGISLHMIDLGGDVTGNGVLKLVFTILSAVAEAERDRTRERIQEVKKDQRDRGRYLGGTTPFGYRLGEAGELVEDPVQQEAVKRMRRLTTNYTGNSKTRPNGKGPVETSISFRLGRLVRSGGDENVTAPFPDKPKGMHWQSYDRLRGVHDHAFERPHMGLAKSAKGMDRGRRTSRTGPVSGPVAPAEAAYGFEPAPRPNQPSPRKAHRRRQQLDWGRCGVCLLPLALQAPDRRRTTSNAMRRESKAANALTQLAQFWIERGS